MFTNDRNPNQTESRYNAIFLTRVIGILRVIFEIDEFINLPMSFCISSFEFLLYVGLLLSYNRWNSSMCLGKLATAVVISYICSLAIEEKLIFAVPILIAHYQSADLIELYSHLGPITLGNRKLILTTLNL